MKDIPSFRANILRRLNEDALNESFIINELNTLDTTGSRKVFYSRSLELFVNLTFDESAAKKHWTAIFENYDHLKEHVDRDVGLRVAIFDYFINLNRSLESPILVEIHLFRVTSNAAALDSLTGLFNRKYMEIFLEKEIKRSIRHDKPLSILLVDLDNFKEANDTKGHLFGDKILKQIAVIVKSVCRTEDAPCRFGGDEFLIILPETAEHGAIKLAERLRESISRSDFLAAAAITASIGIASCPADGINRESLIKNADSALYKAKYSGKDCIVKFRSKIRRKRRFPHAWEMEFQPLDDTLKKMTFRRIYTQDISIGGIRFESEQSYTLGTKMIINIHLPSKEDMVVVGKIVWAKKHAGAFMYGVQFYDLNNEQLKKIKQILPNEFDGSPEG
ncbi:MAG: diguanylate cyclase [Spirochaetota bacterium]